MDNNIEHFFNEDCIEGAKKHIKDNSVDLIISDPPYGIDGANLDKHYNRNENFVIDGYVEVPQSEYAEFSKKWINEAARVLRPGGSIYIVSGYTNLHHVLNALHSTNLVEINHLIWKYNFGVHTTKKYVSSHYHILFWQKPGGEPTFNTYCRYGDSEKEPNGASLNYMDREDVFVINREYKPGEVKNKNELPTALLSKLILYSSNPGNVVLDMFLGGGSTAFVSKGLNRIPMGFELSKNAYEMSIKRINSTEPGSLFNKMKIPEANVMTNSRKSWTDEERKKMIEMISDCKGKTKGETIEYLSKKLGRGRFGISNELDKMGIDVSSMIYEKKEVQYQNTNQQISKKRGRPKGSIKKKENMTNSRDFTSTKDITLMSRESNPQITNLDNYF